MRLLVVTAWYAPLSHPRAHRWTAIAEQWATEGHEVHVVCAQQRGAAQSGQERGVQVHRVGYDSLKSIFFRKINDHHERGHAGRNPARPSWPMRVLMSAYRHWWQRWYYPDDACVWHRSAHKKIVQLLDNQIFDAVYTVSYPFTGHLLGLGIRQRYPHLRWVADVGDPFGILEPPINRWRTRSRADEQRVLCTADAVVVTTEATAQLFKNHYDTAATRHLRVIAPLLHPLPTQVAHPTIPPDGGIELGFFGTLYLGIRPPDALLALLAQTEVARPDLAARLRVRMWGNLPVAYADVLARHPSIRLEGWVPRPAAQAAMQRSHALLHLGNATPHQLPSKVVDYLAAGRPVVHLSSVDSDPFVAFWGAQAGLLCLRYRGAAGFDDADMQHWLAFLEADPAHLSVDTPDVSAYGVEQVAAAYLAPPDLP
jgi:glycosyltransferase involved in cell wall biosynthesis